MKKNILLLFSCFLILCSCKHSRRINAENIDPLLVSNVDSCQLTNKEHNFNLKPHVKVFLENSGSMFAYVNGNTVFKETLSKLIYDLELFSTEMNFNFVNTEVYSQGQSVDDFLNKMNPALMRVGNTNTSNLNKIFKEVLNRTDENSMSVLISDGVYSINASKEEIISALNIQKGGTRNAFFKRLKEENLETVIVKLNSNFKGKFFPVTGNHVKLEQNRPYYIWLFGNTKMMSQSLEKLDIESWKGYVAHARYFNLADKKINYALLPHHSDTPGTYKFPRHDNDVRTLVEAHRESRGEKRGRFGFAFAVDLSDLPLSERYIMNNSHYQSDGDYEVSNVVGIDEVSEQTKYLLGNTNYTHVIYLESANKIHGNIKLRLVKEDSPWIANTHSEDDSNIVGDTITTFGFGTLVKGISEAYDLVNDSPDYSTFIFSIKLN